MVSVTQRISAIKQPRGGYLPSKMFAVRELTDSKELNEVENLHAVLIGICVDYLTRLMNGAAKEEAFRVSLIGAMLIRKQEIAAKLLDEITGLDDSSIINACRLSGFDVVYRAGSARYKPVEEISPDKATIDNIRIMVERSLAFLEEFGPVKKDGFTFEGGYTDTIDSGDGDFLTEDTLWDFKVSKSAIKKEQTLQLLVYYLMGINSVHGEFQMIDKLGIFNPRQNKIYLLEIDRISDETIELVSNEVIGY
ncbi:hypothetical protein DDV21_011420 [Streptococcus chenjunshii]|uniref:Uncharacterized protein n=1 Tax=Streptococcus chenjunshii TaxID=2173853 RepID=A0A372KLE1_9STRE|nr:hypothetical protein [Streptococcus chenjunshii]AXQ79791.1 hypothetical protein DDV21_011420 [Streptococcus chenjunshii]RFU51067.1 hypothetical protein DDV22_05630 [Streptococcus chenjunshii]RFU53111.1 hypothetical protein DDV23_06425 [Streptococcus chenjunshii]